MSAYPAGGGSGLSGKAHVLAAAMSIASLVFILRAVRRRQLRAKYSLLWLSIGAAFVVMAAVPGVLDWTAHRLGVDYPPALLFIVGIIFLLLVAVHLSWEVSRLEERTRVLAEEVALLRSEMHRDPTP